MTLKILLTFFLVLLNAFFVAAEFAIVKVRVSQIQLKGLSGSRTAKLTEHIISNLVLYLSASQLGITIASLALGWIGESIVAEMFSALFGMLHISLSAETIHRISLPTAFITITALHIVLGETAPKALAVQYPESTALIVALPLRAFYFVFKPLIWALNSVSNSLLKLIGIQSFNQHDLYSNEELRLLLDQGKEAGVIKTSEHELITNVFDFSERTVKQIMVPRAHMIALNISTPGDRGIDFFIEEGFSRIPVYQNTIDNIIGIVHAKDFIALMHNPQLIILHDLIRPPYFVPETTPIHKLLRDMQRKHNHMAIVVDEFGGTSGIITLEDILEELVGEIQDEHDDEKPAVEKIGPHEYTVRATTAITDANEHLPRPLPESDQYETIAGLMNFIFGKIPELQESMPFAGYECTILQKAKRSVALVKFKELDEEEDKGLELPAGQ
ncbi:MAG: hemolysin family protein [Pseudomonadota bacterium]